MDVVYSLRRHPYAEGRTYQNPRHFTGPLKDAKHVFIEGDFPKVASAYKRAGVTVTELGPTGPVEGPAAYVEHPRSAEDRAKVDLPEDWRDLPWTGPLEAGLTLRGLGAIFSDEPVRTKAEAVAAIEAEIERRG